MRDLPRGTQVADLEAARFVYGAITLYGRLFQVVRLCIRNRFVEVLQPP